MVNRAVQINPTSDQERLKDLHDLIAVVGFAIRRKTQPLAQHRAIQKVFSHLKRVVQLEELQLRHTTLEARIHKSRLVIEAGNRIFAPEIVRRWRSEDPLFLDRLWLRGMVDILQQQADEIAQLASRIAETSNEIWDALEVLHLQKDKVLTSHLAPAQRENIETQSWQQNLASTLLLTSGFTDAPRSAIDEAPHSGIEPEQCRQVLLLTAPPPPVEPAPEGDDMPTLSQKPVRKDYVPTSPARRILVTAILALGGNPKWDDVADWLDSHMKGAHKVFEPDARCYDLTDLLRKHKDIRRDFSRELDAVKRSLRNAGRC